MLCITPSVIFPGEETFFPVKVVRPVCTNSPKTPFLMVLSDSGRITPTVVRDVELSMALGGRQAVNYICTVEGNQLRLIQEA